MSAIKMKQLAVTITEQEYDLLRAIGEPVEVLAKLADHAAQGIRRPGAWEADWIRQCFGEAFEENLEQDPICYGKHWINFRTIGTKGQADRLKEQSPGARGNKPPEDIL